MIQKDPTNAVLMLTINLSGYVFHDHDNHVLNGIYQLIGVHENKKLAS